MRCTAGEKGEKDVSVALFDAARRSGPVKERGDDDGYEPQKLVQQTDRRSKICVLHSRQNEGDEQSEQHTDEFDERAEGGTGTNGVTEEEAV